MKAQLVLLFLCVAYTSATFSETAKQISKRAYYLIDESPFDSNAHEQARILIEKGYEQNPDEPWLYITSSLLMLHDAYKIGSRFNATTYDNATFLEAVELAEVAKSLGREEGQAWVNLANYKIISRDLRGADRLLDRAGELDPNNFYLWYYRSVVNYARKEYEYSRINLEIARGLTTHYYQRKLITRQNQRNAKKMGDIKLQEELYVQNIRDFPENAYMYGNYANFLKYQKRFRESALEYQKAVAINPYGRAVEQLKKVKALAGL